MNFKELNELDLSDNNISDINVLKKVKFEKLKKLDLSRNDISDITVFKVASFKKLKKLNLSYNEIDENKNKEIISDLKKLISNVNI